MPSYVRAVHLDVSFIRGLHSIRVILVKFELDLFTIMKRHAKFHLQLVKKEKLFWVILITEVQTNKQTDPDYSNNTSVKNTVLK